MLIDRASRIVAYAAVTLALLFAAFPAAALAGPGRHGTHVVLQFEPTAMLANTPPAGTWPAITGWPPNGTNPSVKGMGAKASMIIDVVNGKTNLQFFVRGARPNTLYTIWTVFSPLVWCSGAADQAAGCPAAFGSDTSGWGTKPGLGKMPTAATNPSPGTLSDDAWCASFTNHVDMTNPTATQAWGKPCYYPEGGAVAPTTSMAKAFTSGMGLDPGATFYTNGKGDGEIHVTLDYDLLGTTYDDGPPVGNGTTVQQCATPGKPLLYSPANCPTVTTLVNGTPVLTQPKFTVTSSWLRKYIIQMDNYADCANYDPTDPGSVFWQCIDPATVDARTGNGLPRVWRFPFDHFRLAAHPDDMTHGFIGGSGFEHTIDMVGRRCSIDNSCAK